ncbi:MAG: hypothetical protein ACOCTI_05195 [Phycisphaeraceae bacterium]
MEGSAADALTLGRGNHTYRWIDHWAELPDTPSVRENGRTHGVAVSKTGHVYVFCQADPAVLIFNQEGEQIGAWGDRFPGAHGLTLVEQGDEEYLWLTDEHTGEVVRTTLDGRTVQNLQRPDHPAYRAGGSYSPTWVAENEERFGGNGDIWVADGYGASLVHRYDRAGAYRGTLTGEEGDAGAFDCPHGIAFDFRRGEGELYVADRGNRQVQVFGGDGRFRRTLGRGVLHSPCMFSFHGEEVLIPELHASVVVLDGKDELVVRLGDNEDSTRRHDTWPDHHVAGRPELIQPGLFNSPHAATADAEGNLYVVEWLIGGRITKLARQ